MGVILVFSTVAEKSWMKQNHFSITETMCIDLLSNLAWAPFLRIPFGDFSDRISTRVHTRKQLIVMLLFAVVSWVGVCLSLNRWVVICFLTLGRFGTAFGITILDAEMIRFSKKHEEIITPKCIRARTVGVIASSFCSGWLLTTSTERVVFSVQTILCFIYACIVSLVYCCENNTTDYSSVNQQEEEGEKETEPLAPPKTFCSFLQDPFIVFLSLTAILPNFDMSVFYFIFGPLHISPIQLSRIEIASGVVSILMTFLPVSLFQSYRRNLFHYAWITSFMNVTLLAFITRILIRYISDMRCLLVLSLLGESMESLLMNSYAVYSTEKSSTKDAAKSFATYMSIPSACSFISGVLGSLLNHVYDVDHGNFNHLPHLLVIYCSCFYIPFLYSFRFLSHEA